MQPTGNALIPELRGLSASLCHADANQIGKTTLRLVTGGHRRTGEGQEAESWFVPAFLAEGTSLFADDDPKYPASFRDKLQPPPGGWAEGR